ncbi:MAG: DNA polymerase III subunit alpha, partial [Spirochaetae bacterium HGW-Spirochaetae-8]
AASRIEGLPRGLSMHCGGMVITPDPICRYAPIETSVEGYPLLTWEKEGTEAAGLVKIDLLGNRSLAVIRDALADLHDQGIDIDPLLWQPTEDQRTIEALARGDSMGVFYIESPAMRQLQKKTGKGDFAHIVIHSSIIRPAANKYIAEYVRRLKGGPWNALHPRLAYILDETYGILCYQEDVSKTAMALAGFNEADADKLRKVIAKKAGAAKLALYEQQFFNGCRCNGVEEETIKQVWAMMLSFDGYSFCKPHSASYAMVSFQSAYLRVHHPAAFMAAVLSNQGGYYRPQAYISESRRMGLGLEGPDVNLSRYRYHSAGSTVIIGLMAVGRLSATGARQLIEERERGGLYASLTEVCDRLHLCREDIVALVGAGAFDSLAPGRPRSSQVRILLSSRHVAEISRQETLFPVQSKLRLQDRQTTDLSTTSMRSDAELLEEFQILGFLRAHHPLLLWRRELSCLRRIQASGIAAFLNRRVTLLGWPVTQKEVWTKDGLSMDFVSFEDESALYETVLFPQVFERYRTLLFGQQPLLVTGMVRNDQGALNIEVLEIRPAVQSAANLPKTRERG